MSFPWPKNCQVRCVGQGATAPALLRGAEEPSLFLDGHLACDLPGLAGGDAFVVNSLWAGPCVAAVAMAPLAFIHPRRVAPVRGDVLDDKGPCGLQRLPSFGGHTVDL